MKNEQGHYTEPKPHNDVFLKLNAGSDFTGAIAYALYKAAKREWLTQYEEANGTKPTEDELRRYNAAQTDLILKSHRANADKILSLYAETVKKDLRPVILEEALRGSFSRSFWPSFWASLAFTGVLLTVVLIAALLGFGFPVQISLPAKPSL
jgi:hypothetical protein